MPRLEATHQNCADIIPRAPAANSEIPAGMHLAKALAFAQEQSLDLALRRDTFITEALCACP
jgi:hypothetical protein